MCDDYNLGSAPGVKKAIDENFSYYTPVPGYPELRAAISNKFKRDNNNLQTTVDIDLYLAVLGGEITLDTFDGKVKLKVKPETQNGTKIKLKGKGFPVYKKEGEFGDLYIIYNVMLPTKLTAKEKELFKQLTNLR